MDSKSKQLSLNSENNSTEEKSMNNPTNEWLTSIRDNMLSEEYIRLNYKSIIDSIINKMDSIEEKTNEELFNNLIEIMIKTLEYNRRHPSPQRSFELNDNIEKLVNKLSINPENYSNEDLINQNLLIKAIKLSIKDSNNENNSNDIVINITEKLLNFLKSLKLTINSQLNTNSMISLNNLILNTIRCIFILINNFKYNIISRDLNQFCGELLGVLKLYSFYGIPGYDMSKIRFTAIYPSNISQYVPNDSNTQDSSQKKGSVNRKTRHKKNKSNNLIKKQDLEDENEYFYVNSSSVKTSDSEFSSSDYDSIQTFDDFRIQRSIANKIRLISYESLSSALNLFDKRVIFGFWSSFIPDSSGPLIPFSILSSILKDPSVRVRSSALNFLNRLLLTGDQFVMNLAADKSLKTSKQLSFTPLSQSLAAMVSEIHKAFDLILFGERNTSVLIQAFKCLSLLITISPYNKLKTGLLSNVFYKSLFMLSHKDIQIQNFCLAIIVKIFELEPIPEDLKSWISSSDGIQAINKLFDICFNNVLSQQSIILCGESLKVLTTVLRQKSIIELLLKVEEINLSIDSLMNIAFKCVESDVSLQNHVIQNLVCKYLFAIGNALKYNSSDITEEVVLKHKNWWSTVLKSQLITYGLNSDNTSIPQSSQCVIIDFISTISPDVFELLETKEKFHLISILLSIARSETISDDISCRSASIRCLGVYQSFKSMTEDLNYLFDVSLVSIEVIQNFLTHFEENEEKKSSFLLLYQSSWTLANFCDILKKYYSENVNDIEVSFLFKVIECVINGFDLNIPGIQGENIKTNFVRIIGCVLYLIFIREEKQSTLDLKNSINNKNLNIILDSIQKLINCLLKTKSFKLHWNVCYVFSYLLTNDLFLELCKSNTSLTISKDKVLKSDLLLIDYIFDTLVTVMKSSRNHKVQSYAVHAICSPNNTFLSGLLFKDLWILITIFMIDNYYSVPLNIRQNWFEKFCFSINKLINNCFDTNVRNDTKVSETISKLSEFLTNDIFVMSCDQQNSEIVKNLIEKLKT